MTPGRHPAGALALAALMLAWPAAAQLAPKRTAAEERSVVLVNRHLETVREAYLSASTESQWGPDRLGTATLAAGEDATVTVPGGCLADIRIVFPNGAAEERRAVDLCATPRVVLRPGWTVAENLGEEDDPAMPAATAFLRVRNAGRLPIVELYAFPPGGERGEDRLGDDILPIGATFEIEPEDANACAADLLAVFRDGREVARPGVDLCSGEEIELR